ncbi:MAG: anaerobic sulfatase maturase [Deltaproteobacteria bacterium]|nr:anaerobic sulfatase maturase [Deltaproteobacteria bacterium]
MTEKIDSNRNPGVMDGTRRQAFELMAKPAGPGCNLRCTYCFYLEKSRLFPESEGRMSDEVLEAYTREYIASQPGPSVSFAWQGGEPTLMGIDFFRRALDLQRTYSLGKHISNTLQTNGTLIDRSWCEFLSRNRFLVGLSIDGPDTVHDFYRLDGKGRPTHARVLGSLKMMQQYGVEINVLATVNRESARRPLEVYHFLKEQGVRFIQYIPIVERQADAAAENHRIPLDGPPSLTRKSPPSSVTDWSVRPRDYGDFLTQIFREWVRHDVGDIFVMNFEWALGAWAGMPAGVCYLSHRCGLNLIIEHNGDIFSCDHFVYPPYRLGNILADDLREMVFSERHMAFGASKETGLPRYCRHCDFLFACRGGCPKYRFAISPEGEPGVNYLCAGFKGFYHHVDSYMKDMVKRMRNGIPVKHIMEKADELAESEDAERSSSSRHRPDRVS